MLPTDEVKALECFVDEVERVSAISKERSVSAAKSRSARAADRAPIEMAVSAVRSASGDVEDREPTPEEQGKNVAAVRHGQAGPIDRLDKCSLRHLRLSRTRALSRVGVNVKESNRYYERLH